MRQTPYVIDIDQDSLTDVLNQVLNDHADMARDIAAAFFNVSGCAVG